MAGKSGFARQIERVRTKFIQELDINKLLPRLLRKGVFTISEEKRILEPTIPQKRTEVLLDILLNKDRSVFVEFCRTLEDCAPHLLTAIILDAQQAQGRDEDNPPTQALQLGLEIALKERDAVLRENAKAQEERDEALRHLEQVRVERDQALLGLETLRQGQLKEKTLDVNINTQTRTGSKKVKDMPVSIETDQAFEEAGSEVLWETHNVRLHKVPTFGFGIAVSGGRDSPHFANGDVSVAISDVLKAGPAEGRLQINDRIVSVNGISLENVDHHVAINVLRDSGNVINLVVRRRVLLPPSQVERSTAPLTITLTKKNKKDEFGFTLGCKLFIKEITPHSLASQESALTEGDTLLKINNTPVENISLAEAKKLVEKSRDKLQLLVKKERGFAISAAATAPQTDLVVPDKEDINLFRPSLHPEEFYLKEPSSRGQHVVPYGAYPNSDNTRYDGHYVLDNDFPSVPRPQQNNIPQYPEDVKSFPSDRDVRDGYYSDRESGWREAGQVRGSGDYLKEMFPEKIVHDLEPRSVTFLKDKQTGLGLRLAGGNATGIFIASVQPGSAGQREGLVEGDQIIEANEREITGLTREEAVSYLTSLEGQVTLAVHYRKEDYDRIMSSHEAGDSFYIRTHFNHTATDISEHSFKMGDIFHVKDTLFRGVGGSWLAVAVAEDLTEHKKGTIPNSKSAEILKNQQKDENDKENFPNRGRGSLFKRKSSRRVKSLGKDHWDEVIFDENSDEGLGTKFPAYERVVYREPGFVRPVVIFGAIADIARERLLAEYPDRFDFPQMEKSNEHGEKKDKSAIIRLGSIREAISRRKHCLLDVTPQNVDRLNYAQYNPIVIFLKADTKQAVKDVRSRWKTAARSVGKLLEHSQKIEKEYSHLFTGQLKHMGTDAWFPKLCEMIDSQQRHNVWMSEKQPVEDMSDDFMFPMSTRLSYAAGADSDLDIARPRDDIDTSPLRKQRLVRSSSDPSINTHENIPGIPPYPSPPTYKTQKIPSHESHFSGSDISPRSPLRDDYQLHPEDRYYPSYYSDHASSNYQASRAHIDPYATLTPSERLRSHNQQGSLAGGLQGYGYPDRMGTGNIASDVIGTGQVAPEETLRTSIPPASYGSNMLVQQADQRGLADNSSHSSDSYSKYVSRPQNKHDDTKLREKFGNLQPAGREKSPGHDPYRFTRSTAQPVTGSVDRAKISDLSARYRKQDNLSKPGLGKPTSHNQEAPAKRDQAPPPIPVKTYSLKSRAAESDEAKMRNYENSNRAYNYTDVNISSGRYGPSSGVPPPLPSPPAASSFPSGLDLDGHYEYVSLRQAQSSLNFIGSDHNSRPDTYAPQQQAESHSQARNSHPGYAQAPPDHQQQKKQQQFFQQSGRMHSLDSSVPQAPLSASHGTGQSYRDSKAFSNEIYMDHQDLHKAQAINNQLSGYTSLPGPAVRGRDDFHGGFPTLERGYARPRTDQEQIGETQRARHRARSETRLAELSGAQALWDGSASSSNLQADFPKSSISNGHNLHSTPKSGGSSAVMPNVGSRNRTNASRYKSWDVSRADAHILQSDTHLPGSTVVPTSAFMSYKKPTKQASFSGTTSTTWQQQQPPGRERRSYSRDQVASLRSHSAGGQLRQSLANSPDQPKRPGSQHKIGPTISDRPGTSPPLPPPLSTTEQPTDITELSLPPPPTETDLSKIRNYVTVKERRPRSPTLTFPPPPEFPPPVLSYIPLPPTQQLVATGQKSTHKKSVAPPPPMPSISPIGSIPDPEAKGLNQSRSAQADVGINGASLANNVSTQLARQTSEEASWSDQTGDNRQLHDQQTIIATVKGVFTCKGGVLESPETGVSIYIPEGAIESNREQEIYFKVCRDNSLLPPLDAEKGETLLSPLVMCGPHGTKFLKSVELRIPHKASANPDSWSFALKSSESPSGQTAQWQNTTLAGSQGMAKGKVGQDCVSIPVDHF